MDTLTHTNTEEEGNDIVLDAVSGEEREVDGEENLPTHVVHAQLVKMREKFKTAQHERDEYLAGWQRAKADIINFRRMVGEEKARDEIRTRGKLVRALVPLLDSFESAMMSKKWTEVDGVWREGVERIANQFHKILEAEGLRVYGAVGDQFDPLFHECMSVEATEIESEDHTIAHVLQKGYAIGDEVVRPAKVVVRQCG